MTLPLLMDRAEQNATFVTRRLPHIRLSTQQMPSGDAGGLL
jgi:hypothetical protein